MVPIATTHCPLGVKLATRSFAVKIIGASQFGDPKDTRWLVASVTDVSVAIRLVTVPETT